ncbi:DNA repair and recombination protein RAD26 [Phytophthora palmivora]|uniref:DNA repair and recombination protein RAD26 n=1 Tax=Phytophthora palmivora TaxID=4796 RepID=A0A2P4Y179_9STRA|nr:DNA repair and recombination protein RAD26 [Phytophthora palmivora]
MNFLPSSKRQKQNASPANDAKEKAMDAAVAAYSVVTPNKATSSTSEKKEKELSAGERIARKYGLKRSFWNAQTADADTEHGSTKKSTYVSPFMNPDGFMNMKRRRQRHQQLTEEMSEEEMKSARDAFYDDSKTGGQDVGPRPRHIIGSAIPEIDNDADEWMSDSKEIVQISEETRLRTKRKPRSRVQKELNDSSEDEKETYTSERWPRLDLPDEGSKTLEVCANLNSYLFDYQREGVEFLYSAYKHDTGAILGDDMGLGKTVQVIAFLSAIMGKYGDHRDKDAWRVLLNQRRERYSDSGGVGHPEDTGFSFAGEVAPIFVVVPASLLQNWEQELHTWMSCTTIILRGKPSERDAMIDQIARGEYEIVICSYDILKMYLSRLHKIQWEAVILDEMHCLKNPEAKLTQAVKAIKCRKKLGLTGTLMQNNEKELHCLVDTIAPGAIGSWAEFNLYYGQDIKYGRKKSAAPEAVKRSHQKEKELREKLRPYYFRREKEINPTFQEVKKNDQVVFCDLTPLQMAAYQRVLAMPEFQLLQRGEEMCDCGRDSKQKRKKCCYKAPSDLGDDPGLLYERFHENGPCKNCPNCMGLPCVAMLLKLSNHLELMKVNPHDGEELQHYQREFARTAFGSDLDEVGGVNQVSSFQEMCAISTKTCGKMIVLEKLLAVWKKRRQRTLIFSRSTRMLDIIQLFLITKATRFCRLDGSTKVEDRLQMVNDFNNPASNTTVFLISTRAGGVGLNLQSATNVVIFDPSWNPAHDCQAQDRAYRIGQTKDVQVYRLITLGTIEEMIYVRQIYKQQLSDTTLKGANAPRYFEGVQGNPQQRGELFGIANLICWKPGGVLKGIQDAYQRSRDGLIIQQNRVRYDSASVSKSAKKSTPKKRPNVIDDDEGEMIEVADELISDVLTPEVAPTPTPTDEPPAAVSSDSCDEDMDALLDGATTFRHEAIVGEQDDNTSEYQLEGSTAVIGESESDLEEHVSEKGSHVQQTSPSPGTKVRRASILSHMKDAKIPTTPVQEGQKRLYVPTYL